MNIHRKIKKIREYREITRHEMADFLNMSLSGYSKIEQGKVEISINKLVKIANYLGVDNYELFRARTDKDIACILNNEPVVKKQDNKEVVKQIDRQDKLIELLEKEKDLLQRENRTLIAENNKLIKQLRHVIQIDKRGLK